MENKPFSVFKAIFITFLLAISTFECFADSKQMDPEQLRQVISDYSQKTKVSGNVISFEYQSIVLYCIWDANADRMRMISPIANRSDLSEEMIESAMKANYHTVLDARYALGDDVLYSAFIHPLSSISKLEIESAIRQVATAAATFGTSYSSGELVFPGKSEQKPKKGQNQSM